MEADPSSDWREGVIPLALGSLGLLITGVQPIVLGALADAGRLSAAGIGQTAMLELLAMGISAGGIGLVLKPSHLRLTALLAALALAAADLACLGAGGLSVMALRAVAGLAEGVLVWISIGFIVRHALPERWAGFFFMAQTVVQFGLASLLTTLVTPRFGANGGLAVMALTALLAAGLALAGPRAYPPLVRTDGEGPLTNARGWVALAATLIFVASGVSVWVYLEPLAHRSGLAASVAGAAVSASLAGQVIGSTAATLSAGRLRYLTVFLIAGVIDFTVWAFIGAGPGAAFFVIGIGLTGFAGMFVTPYIVAMTIEADPTLKAGELSGGAQLLGSAAGPLLASLVVSAADPRGALVLGAVLLAISIATVAGLHLAAVRTVRSR